MAQYTDQTELEERMDNIMLAQLADDRDSNIIRTQAQATTSLALAATIAHITQAIEDASNDVDVELLGHADLTDATLLTRIKPFCTSIAIYYLYTRRYMDEDKNPYRGRYYKALAALKAARKRENRLAINADDPGSQTLSSTISSTKDISSTTLDAY